MKSTRRPHVLCAWILIAASAASARADDRKPADVLPSTTVAYAELRQPAAILKSLEQHDLVARVLALEPIRQAMQDEKFVAFRGVVAVVELQMGRTWQQIAEHSLDGGVAIAWDQATGGVVLLAKATDGVTHKKLVETVTTLASLDAKKKGTAEAIEESEQRGEKIYRVDKLWIAAPSHWLLATNNAELQQQLLDRILDGADDSLATEEQFATAQNAAATSSSAWGYLNTSTLRESGIAAGAYSGRTDNPAAEVLLGGIVSTLQNTPYVVVELTASDSQLRLVASAAHDRGWAGDLREHYFGPQGLGAAPPHLPIDGAILSIGAYRDLSAMWLRAGDLLDEQANEKLAQADSGLSTLFSGKDFGEDVLGAFGPEVRLVVARQDFAEGQPAPAIKLPAFALITELDDPDATRPELRRTFQNLIGFFNVVGAMNGQPQLELAMEKTDAVEFVSASHLPDLEAADPAQLRINYNFSPTVAFAGSRFVIATTKDLALAAATAPPMNEATSNAAGDASRIVNSDVVLRPGALRDILADNQEQLIAQNMLEKGHSREEAEREIGVLLELLPWFDRLALRLDTTPSEIRVSFDLNIRAAD